MLTLKKAMELETKEELLKELKEHVNARDQMGGVLYWNILNDECAQIANKCFDLGVDEYEIGNILGEGTYRRL